MQSMHSAREAPSNLPSLWDIGKGSQFPLHPDDVRELQQTTGQVARLAEQWAERASKPCPVSSSFPGVVPYRRTLPECLVDLDPSEREAVNTIMSGLKLLFGKRGTEVEKYTVKFAMNVVLVKHSSGPGMFMQPCSVTKTPVFGLKLVTYKGQQCGNVLSNWVFDEGTALVLEPESGTLPTGIESAARIAAHVKEQGRPLGSYVFHRAILAADPVGNPPGAFVVAGLSEEIDLEKLRQEDKERAEVCRTLRLLQKCRQPWQHQRVHEKIRHFKLVEKKAKDAKGAAKGAGKACQGKGKAAVVGDDGGAPDCGPGGEEEDCLPPQHIWVYLSEIMIYQSKKVL